MKTVVRLAGLAALVIGGVWCMQGLGIIAWPQESFMIREAKWAWIGGATAIGGLALVEWSRRR